MIITKKSTSYATIDINLLDKLCLSMQSVYKHFFVNKVTIRSSC